MEQLKNNGTTYNNGTTWRIVEQLNNNGAT